MSKKFRGRSKYIGCYLDAPKINNLKIAQGYGVDGELVSSPDKLGKAIDIV